MKKTLVVTIFAALLIAACAPAAQPAAEPTPMPAKPAEEMPTAEPMMKDIVDVAVEAGSFTTLVAAVQAAGLVDAA